MHPLKIPTSFLHKSSRKRKFFAKSNFLCLPSTEPEVVRWTSSDVELHGAGESENKRESRNFYSFKFYATLTHSDTSRSGGGNYSYVHLC